MTHPSTGRLRHIRALAAGEGDWNLVAEVEREMARLGIPSEIESVVPAMVETTAAPRPRGRPRKPR